MKLLRTSLAVAATTALLATVLTGCGGDPSNSTFKMTVGNTAAGKPSAKINSAPATPVTFVSGAYTYTITTARINIRDFGFDPSDGATSSADKIEVSGPFVYDLYNGTASPDIPSFSLPEGTYKRLDIRFDDADLADNILTAGDALIGNTMLVSGTYDETVSPDGASAFSFVLKFNEDLRLAPAGGIAVGEDGGANITMVMQVTDWLTAAGTDLWTCANTELGTAAGAAFDLTDANVGGCGLESDIKTAIKNNYDFN